MLSTSPAQQQRQTIKRFGDSPANAPQTHRRSQSYDGLAQNYRASSPAQSALLVLPERRRNGYGSAYLEAELDQARTMETERIETIVLASNTHGLAFAQARGLLEHTPHPRLRHRSLHPPAPSSADLTSTRSNGYRLRATC